jgi:hypothetical protein
MVAGTRAQTGGHWPTSEGNHGWHGSCSTEALFDEIERARREINLPEALADIALDRGLDHDATVRVAFRQVH